ncbi:NADH-quinone oxidoreductase subunit J [Chitinivorax tropicus]|uniref:NADH-quinone oxidoreductase subunit J n=1 Tax=Chitinivorax tropicus TaxID=714531 RepID=A0A840MRD6_9PROT|nr:NADH-quinone oxidoreductase subunit J [Chitinivorax tropicus]MBB5017781.1 NADH-quinone oxidoreductase subunit J [Chitinivorax tropicus]
MTFQTLIFYFLAAVLIFAAVRVITAKNPVHAALFLVLSFFNGSALWLLIQAEFLGITLVLVYVGAVMVLFLFVVMMLDINFEKLRAGFWKHLPLAGIVAGLMVVEMVAVFSSPASGLGDFNSIQTAATEDGNTKIIGKALYTQFIYPFEIAAIILLVAIVAAIALTLRGRKDAKAQDPGLQAKVKSTDRVRVIKMAAVVEQPVTVDEQKTGE